MPRRYHSSGDCCKELEAPEKIVSPMMIASVFILVYALVTNILLFSLSLFPIVRLEILMDYPSSPITSILPNDLSPHLSFLPLSAIEDIPRNVLYPRKSSKRD